MNKKIVLPLAIVTSVTLIISSCAKKETPVSEFPSVSISSPTNGQTFSDSTIHIHGTATASGTDDAHLLHEVSLSIIKLPDSTELWSSYVSTHDQESHDIDTTVTIHGLTAHETDLILKVQVENHVPKVTTESIPFSIHF